MLNETLIPDYLQNIVRKFPQLKEIYEELVETYLPEDEELEKEIELWGADYRQEKPHFEPSLCAQLMSLERAIKRTFNIQLSQKESQELFFMIEEIVSNSDENVQGFFEVCFFEGLMNCEISKKKQLERLLGPVSLSLYQRNELLWGPLGYNHKT